MTRYDVVVVGAGPAGQKAALQAAEAGRTVAIVDQQREVGGDCVHRGTIPSKALRETALQISRARRTVAEVALPPLTPLASLLGRVGEIIDRHVAVQSGQLERAGITVLPGRATFTSPGHLQVQPVRGAPYVLTASTFVVASGSVPRDPPECPVDHADVLDSDSILSLDYLPQSLVVLGGGVIACEYASTFAELGVEVTVVDSGPRPVSFMDTELSEALLRAWDAVGCRHLPGRSVTRLGRGVGATTVYTADGGSVSAEKVLVALGRVANVAHLGLDAAGVVRTARGQVAVDATYRTNVSHIYAVGDVVGFPALAAASMEQGRRAMRHALGLPVPDGVPMIPIGIYTIPELGQVGLTEAEALAQHGAIRVGRCRFDEVARGQISGEREGVLKLVADERGERLLGVAAAGADANDLVHLGQLAMLGNLPPSTFVDAVLNFPTWGEAYRIAALSLQRAEVQRRVVAPRAAG
jgi:NAD(P) transhydrogenase